MSGGREPTDHKPISKQIACFQVTSTRKKMKYSNRIERNCRLVRKGL